MHLPKLLLTAALAALAILPHRAAAQGGDPFGGKLFPPDLIMTNADAIGLSQEQREGIRDLVEAVQPRFTEMQQQLKGEVDALRKLIEQAEPDQAAVLAQFDKLNDREKEIKRAQLTMLLDLRKKLTEDQRTKLAQLRPQQPQAGPGGGIPQSLRDKMERVKAAATKWQSEGRDVAPVAQIMQQFEATMRAGKPQEAEAVLDQALKILEGGK
jgi:Spy/CpxP family protein refolding chaperone